MLEALQERSATAAGITYRLDDHLFCCPHKTPIEQEGTYPLPEAQLGRFLFNLQLDNPSFEQELMILKTTTADRKVNLKVILDVRELLYFQDLVRKVPVTDHVMEYAVNLASRTRPNTHKAHSLANEYISWGAGPRASQYLLIGAKAHAAIHGKFAPDIEDENAISYSILSHRIVRNYKAEAEGVSVETLIDKISE